MSMLELHAIEDAILLNSVLFEDDKSENSNLFLSEEKHTAHSGKETAQFEEEMNAMPTPKDQTSATV